MKSAKTWCLAGLMIAVGIASTSCGKDETSGNQGDAGKGSIIGGSGGTGGGRSGGDGGGPTAASKLGAGCLNDGQCADAKAPGLKCITSKTTALGDGAPPKGLCTIDCASDDECSAFGPAALCFPFNDKTGYCVEGCSFGEPDIGDPAKCHDRAEFACNPALLGRTEATCKETEDCGAGEVCVDGTCDVVFPACLPACRGDVDCEAGMYCDQAFLSGVCVTKKQTGKALGEPCTLPAEGDPAEPDECLGFCQRDADTGREGHCAHTCSLGNECAWNAGTKKFDGLCLFGSALASSPALGDFGFCTTTCNCTDECNDPELACQQLPDLPLTDAFKGPGLCFSPDPMGKEYNQCAGVGGAGGVSGAGGEPSVPVGGAGGEPGEPDAGGNGGAGG